MDDFDAFFEQQSEERRNKKFKTKKQLHKLLVSEIHSDNEDTGTALRNSQDNVEDITTRNMLEFRDIPLEKISYFFDFRMVSLINCKKLLASISKNFDRKSGTLKVFPVKNLEGDTKYVLLDGMHRYICYKYLRKINVPADILKDSMEEWEWFYIAGGGNVISSTHVPMDIYSKIKLIGEIMERKIDGKVLKANEAKPIIQKNVPGFQEKCSKEIINAYNRMYKSYKTKYLDMIQQVVMRKDAKQHSMVKDNLELPSLMLLEDSDFKENLFQKMGQTKMSKGDVLIHINKHKFIKFVKTQLENKDPDQIEKIMVNIEKGQYNKNLIEEDSFIREGNLQDTKLWKKLKRLVEKGNSKNNEGGDDLSLEITQTRKRKGDIAWKSSVAKRRKDRGSEPGTDEQAHSNTDGNTVEGPLRFNIPCELQVPFKRESQFILVNGEVYLSLTFLEYNTYKLLKTFCRAKLLTSETEGLTIFEANSQSNIDENDAAYSADDQAFDIVENNEEDNELHNNNLENGNVEKNTVEENGLVCNKTDAGKQREKSKEKHFKDKLTDGNTVGTMERDDTCCDEHDFGDNSASYSAKSDDIESEYIRNGVSNEDRDEGDEVENCNSDNSSQNSMQKD